MKKIKVKEPKVFCTFNDDETAVFTNSHGDIIATWNDFAVCDYPEDLTARRDIGELINDVYKKGFNYGVKYGKKD